MAQAIMVIVPCLSSAGVQVRQSSSLTWFRCRRGQWEADIARENKRWIVRAVTQETEKQSDVEKTTRKFGLEAGLWKIFTSKDTGGKEEQGKKQNQAKELLARYGGAYLATSISLSLVSFGLCYALINAGVDVPSLLEKVGIQTSEAGEKVGTFALAYAAHKAASPIRFPPTVALTPIVANWFGKKAVVESEEDK